MTEKIAIDPGWSGAIVRKLSNGETVADRMPKTYQEVMDYFEDIHTERSKHCICVMERVWAQPGNGIKAASSFTENITALKCALYATSIDTILVLPREWQKAMDVDLPKDKKEKKNMIKALMQERYPDIKVTLWNADALAIMSVSEKHNK